MNLTIRARITLLGTLATLSLLWIVGMVSWGEYRTLSAKRALLVQVESEERLSDLIHELQRERGLSAGQLTRPTETGSQALAAQRASTDRVVAQLTSDEIRGLEGFSHLSQARDWISKMDPKPNASFDYYTNTVTEILDRIIELAKESDAGVFKRELYAHAHLMYAKEHLGEIRALLNEGFSQGVIDTARVAAVSQQLGRYYYHIRIFLNDAPAQVGSEFRALTEAPDMRDSLSAIDAVLSGRGNMLADMTTERWFRMVSATIDGLKAVEDKSIALVREHINGDVTLAERTLFTYTMASVATGALLIFLAATAVLRLLHALDIVLTGVETVVGSKDFSHRIKLQSRDEMGVVAQGFNELLDIAERLIQEKTFLASSDPLTGAFNRYKFAEIFHQELQRERRYNGGLTLLMFDIDHFKLTNDRHGHAAGDAVLKEMADLVRDNIRGTDALVRWGGEEFVILTPEQHIEKGQALAEKLRGIVASHAFPDIQDRITASFGVAEYVAGDTLETLCAKADHALYRAKNEGRNRVCIEPMVPTPVTSHQQSASTLT